MNPDVLAAGTYFEDAVAITRQLKELYVNPKMFAVTLKEVIFWSSTRGVGGEAAQFVYGPAQWEAELVTLRAGGLIPIARQHPGASRIRRVLPGRVSRRRAVLSLRLGVRLVPGARGSHQTRGFSRRRQGQERHSHDGPEHRLWRLQG